jgi:hypothetical protein
MVVAGQPTSSARAKEESKPMMTSLRTYSKMKVMIAFVHVAGLGSRPLH